MADPLKVLNTLDVTHLHSMTPPVCRDFLQGRCRRDVCRFSHDATDMTNTSHSRKQLNKAPHRKPKNTESFEPLSRPVDMRVVYDLGSETLSTEISSRDVLLVPNLFQDYAPGELYRRLVEEIQNCGVPQDQLLKLWHGDTHLIADDHTRWKDHAPTFAMILERVRSFFQMDIQATRFNWYQDTSQWKPFHHDAAAIKPKQAATQNFTVAVSFGATREAAFEDARTKTVLSIPQPDGTIYAFAKDTNILWKHGILKDKETRPEGRISIICWGWMEKQVPIQPTMSYPPGLSTAR